MLGIFPAIPNGKVCMSKEEFCPRLTICFLLRGNKLTKPAVKKNSFKEQKLCVFLQEKTGSLLLGITFLNIQEEKSV